MVNSHRISCLSLEASHPVPVAMTTMHVPEPHGSAVATTLTLWSGILT